MAEPSHRRRWRTGSPGPGVDIQGLPVLDPTENVLQVLAAAIQRQDDLRHNESAHLRELIALRASYEEQLRRQEAARIDAIRAVDIAAVSRAAEVSAAQATTLAAQVATAAEAMRAHVAATAEAAATALATALEPIQTAVNDLRKAQYEAQGQKVQQSQGRETNQWTLGIMIAAVGLGMVIVQVILHYAVK